MRKRPSKYSAEGYSPFPDHTYDAEAQRIQQRVNNHKNQGYPVSSENVWAWIKQSVPGWHEADWYKIFQRVKR